MTVRLGTLPLAAALFAAMLLGAPRAHAATFLGSLDATAPPDAFACAGCQDGAGVGFRQFALRLATVEAPENGVLVSASVHAKRIAPGADPQIAVLRADDDDGVRLTVVDSVPVRVDSAEGRLYQLDDLHLEMRSGDSIGFLFRAGEVDLGVRRRPRPDGAIQSFPTPCDPCGMDGGTGVELLLDAVLEPDVDGDGMGDESQDEDGGGLGLDWEEDWFEDYEEGDRLDEDFDEDEVLGPRGPQRLRVLGFDRLRGGRASLLLRVPRKGRVGASVTLPADRRTGAGPFLTILTGDMRVRRAGRVRVVLAPTPSGERVLARRKRVRTRVVVAFFPRKTTPELRMRSARL